MKRILYIATSNIYLKSGGGIANLAILNSLNKEFSEYIDVLIYEEALKGKIVPPNFITIPSISRLKKFKNILAGRINRFTPWLDNFLKLNGHKYSHCFINSGMLGEYVNKFKEIGIKVLVIHHNYEPEFQIDNRRPSTLFGFTDIFVKRSERKSYLQADVNVFLSEDDRNKFHQEYKKPKDTNEYTIGVFEPCDSKLPIPDQYLLNPFKAVICGSLNSVQTILGLRDFFKNYFSIMMNYYKGNFILKLAGRNPNREIYKISEKYSQIEIIPNPLVMSEVIVDCGIFICPTNVGGGIKLRILDGLKLGMPILVHEISARGYNAIHNRPWFKVYHNKETFLLGLEEIVTEIRNNPNLRTEIISEYNKLFSFKNGDELFRKVSKDFLKL